MHVTYVYVSYISHKFIDSPIKGPQGHIQYEHDLLQLYYNIASNEKGPGWLNELGRWI